MPIDPDLAIGLELPGREFAWTSADVIRYHLAIGAGADFTDPGELRYVYGPAPKVLPTFGLTAPAALGVAAPIHYRDRSPEIVFPGLELDLGSLLQAGLDIEVLSPLSADGAAGTSARVVDIHDKGSAAILVQRADLSGAGGERLMSITSSIYARGEGGFGGDRGPSVAQVQVPAREPTANLLVRTLPQQALLYRMCGENNPVHVDPELARRAGLARPIMQGVCVFGMVCKAVVDALLDGDPTRVGRFRARFTGVVYPGETLLARVWRRSEELIIAVSVPERDNHQVLADCVLSEF
ncbi:MaoC/PaaZ C-terminal domain-containing protein [Pseudonocardia spinosispora]|uniref:MaoC/PaaZ C-terminal domain-containing protein n=1 Tax=Pseudonocardia spinosispora TaxID=103441 RepID=UPI00041B8A49|nr:MaoC/PaaZ C-terminal domain-containing protein [Pseudonocardia spinosispora]